MAIRIEVEFEWQVTESQRKLLKMVERTLADPTVCAFTQLCLKNAPSYFWSLPASTSGKYHPSFAAGKGGLVRHTIAAVQIAIDLLCAYPNLDKQPVRDNILAALFIHDTLKCGLEEKHTVEEHPFLVRDYYSNLANLIGEKRYDQIMKCVEIHMGIWTPGNDLVNKERQLDPGEFVHLCDYISSRKVLEQIVLGEIF